MVIADKQRLEQIHDLAANYSDRQGLRIVPMALVILVESSRLLPDTVAGGYLELVFLLAGILSYFLVGKAYERRFGHIEELPVLSAGLTLQLFLLLLLLPIATIVDVIAHPPVFVSGLLLSLWIAANAWPARTVRVSYLVFSLLLALICLLPMTGEPRALVAQNFGLAFGGFFLLAGVMDHFRLVQLLSAPEESDEPAAV